MAKKYYYIFENKLLLRNNNINSIKIAKINIKIKNTKNKIM